MAQPPEGRPLIEFLGIPAEEERMAREGPRPRRERPMPKPKRHQPSRQLGQFLSANYATGITRYPNGRYGLVGSVPAALAYDGDGRTRTWATEQEVIDALLGIGLTRFQRADCSWYRPPTTGGRV
jgi:hypothetical protein